MKEIRSITFYSPGGPFHAECVPYYCSQEQWFNLHIQATDHHDFMIAIQEEVEHLLHESHTF